VLQRLSNEAPASKLDSVRTEQINEHFLNPQNVGAIDGADGSGEAASFECGGIVRISLLIDARKTVTKAKFKAIGCHALVATASLLTEKIKGKTTAAAAQLARSGEQAVVAASCVALCRDALLSAIARYSDSVRDEWTGDEALICTCFGVSESEVEGEISAASLRTIEEVTSACKAGAGCRSCYPLIQDILDVHWREKNMPG